MAAETTPLPPDPSLLGAGLARRPWLRPAAWPGRLARRVCSPTVAAAAAAGVLLFVLTRAGLQHLPGARAALATLVTLLALRATWLLRTRCLESRRLSDLLLFAGVATVTLGQLGLGLAPAVLDLPAAPRLAAGELLCSLLAGAIVAAATYVPSRVLVLGWRRPLTIGALAALGAAALAHVGGWLLRGQLVGQPGGSPLADPAAHPVAVVVAATATALLGLGGHRLAARRAEVPDGASIGAALVLMAGSVFYLLVLGRPPEGRFAAGDLANALALGLILLAALRHARRARQGAVRAAALAERSRVARDLHDGLAQDLALIAAHLPSLAADHGQDHPVVHAARRALALTRTTISELSDPAAVSCPDALSTVAEELRSRFGLAITVDAQLDPRPVPTACEHLSRIAREAIVNAARHGDARHVVVSLRREGDEEVLRIADDGRGLHRAGGGLPPEGFGLRSIRERAAVLGGTVTIREPRRGGTVLEVVLR